MYELTCPSCRAARRLPFIRLGAVTRCPGCGHAWRISGSHVERRRPVVPADLAEAKPVEPSLAEPPPPADPLGGSSVTGLSGLTEIMQHEPVPNTLAATEAPLQAKLTQPKVSSETPKPFSPKTRRTAILIIGVLALAVAVAGLLVSVVASGQAVVPGHLDRTPRASAVEPGRGD